MGYLEGIDFVLLICFVGFDEINLLCEVYEIVFIFVIY